MWLTWRPDYFTVTYIDGNAHAITFKVLNIILNVEFLLIVVYGTIQRKKEETYGAIWKQLRMDVINLGS